jgi:hypothetical protein
MSQRETINFIFFLTGLLGLSNATLLVRRRLFREVPWFATYIALVLAHVVVDGYLFNVDPMITYYYIGWIFQGAGVVLEMMITIEVMRNILVDYPTVRRLGRHALIAAGVTFLLIAISVLPYGSEHSGLYMKVTHLTMRSARLIQVGLIVAFFALARYLALAAKQYQFGILLGLGLYVSASLSCEAYVTQVGPTLEWGGMLIDSFAYLITLLLWLICLYRQEPKLPQLPASTNADLDGWNATLTDLLRT